MSMGEGTEGQYLYISISLALGQSTRYDTNERTVGDVFVGQKDFSKASLP